MRKVTYIIHLMKVAGPPLLPILRSKNQAQILTIILLSPERGFTISELVAKVEASQSTVSREVQRAEMAGLVTTRGVGRSTFVVADTGSVLFEPLARLLLVSFGPSVVVGSELADIEGIREAFIFGSWAARYSGQSGPAPRDLDILVIGNPDRSLVWAAADRIEKRVGMPVQVTVRTSARWAAPGEDPFLQEVRSRPLVPVDLPDMESA